MAECVVDDASFRDPSGHIFTAKGRVFRTITRRAAPGYEALRDQGLLRTLAEEGLLVAAEEVDAETFGAGAGDAVHVVEHPRLPFITYPYEWPFSALKAAALFHLDLHLRLLEHGATLSDASAYNLQFDGARPLFIDLLSLRPYREGEFWLGHEQFTEQFLNPLLLTAYLGVAYHGWYRGALEGISSTELARLLPTWRKLDWRVLTHVLLPERFQARAARPGGEVKAAAAGARRLPLNAYKGLLRQLRGWIARLQGPFGEATTWSDYDRTHGYNRAEFEAKRGFVARFAEAVRPKLLWDLGCNTGEFSELALASGAARVIGFDYDQGALEKAFSRANDRKLAFQPLYLDAANPSPDQGWRQRERKGLAGRARPDAIVALAFEHHLAIGRNVPLVDLVGWLTGLADRGVIEFVEKSDPRIQRMLMLREDIFDRYDKPAFESALSAHARIVEQETVSSSRTLYWYDRI
jgi:ribosomal protein L11 methylase PrmA